MTNLSKEAIRDGLRILCHNAHKDAQAHGLYERYQFMDEPTKLRAMAYRIEDEAAEAACATTRGEYGDELADVIITAASVAEEAGIDLADHVIRKMLFNESRPMYHGKEPENA